MRIVMTGATSGIGLNAARVFLARSDMSLVVGARAPEGAPTELARATLHHLDMASLQSVRKFAEVARTGPAIDALILNAGLQISRPEQSVDGFEMTFAVNHLAHYLLSRELAAHLAPNARIVFTSSGTHDPDEKTGIPPPRHADALKLAFPDTDQERDANPVVAGRRAYSTSKLCNILNARALRQHLSLSRPDIAVASFDPGFTPGTGLARSYPAILRFAFENALPHIKVMGERQSTPARSGGFLAALALGEDARFSEGHDHYFSVKGARLERVEPSRLARDAAIAAKLWRDSAELVGLNAD